MQHSTNTLKNFLLSDMFRATRAHYQAKKQETTIYIITLENKSKNMTQHNKKHFLTNKIKYIMTTKQ